MLPRGRCGRKALNWQLSCSSPEFRDSAWIWPGRLPRRCRVRAFTFGAVGVSRVRVEEHDQVVRLVLRRTVFGLAKGDDRLLAVGERQPQRPDRLVGLPVTWQPG